MLSGMGTGMNVTAHERCFMLWQNDYLVGRGIFSVALLLFAASCLFLAKDILNISLDNDDLQINEIYDTFEYHETSDDESEQRYHSPPK